MQASTSTLAWRVLAGAMDFVVTDSLSTDKTNLPGVRGSADPKGISRSIYRHDPIISKIVPNLLGQCLRYAIYCLLGNTDKVHKAEGGIMKSCGYLAGKLPKLHGQL